MYRHAVTSGQQRRNHWCGNVHSPPPEENAVTSGRSSRTCDSYQRCSWLTAPHALPRLGCSKATPGGPLDPQIRVSSYGAAEGLHFSLDPSATDPSEGWFLRVVQHPCLVQFFPVLSKTPFHTQQILPGTNFARGSLDTTGRTANKRQSPCLGAHQSRGAQRTPGRGSDGSRAGERAGAVQEASLRWQ